MTQSPSRKLTDGRLLIMAAILTAAIGASLLTFAGLLGLAIRVFGLAAG